MTRILLIVGAVAGSYAGSAIPLLWGDSFLSMASVFFSAIGGFLGIYFAYGIARRLE
jgi:hypothetical protein